ncbi:hypothetical protein AAE478_009713 [Parahypoxylon ruwenzoriense]
MDSLVLEGSRKGFIRSLVGHYRSKTDDSGFDDFVRDKGKGLVGLLACPPGVGKPFTAEAVAEITRRPLYSSARLWRAVVLLDEVDVFLVKRDDQNLARNAVTSVFLRLLEYYQGILLLTTNRLDSLDDAFQSRIHFCFKYRQLDAEARRSIRKSFLDRAKTISRIDCKLDEDAITALSQKELNGRQIKNVMSISQAVATQEEGPITMDIITLALDSRKEIA